jgi:uncharacterized protein
MGAGSVDAAEEAPTLLFRIDTEMLMVAIILALLVGASLGLLGGGGSILTVPILRYVLGMEGHAAIAASLLVVGTTSLAGLFTHARRGRVQWRTGFIFGAAGMLGAYLSARVAHLLPSGLLLVAFSAMMFATALAMLRPERRRREGSPKSARPAMRLPIAKILLEGLAVGTVTGLVGAGGGFLVVPALVLLGRLPMDAAIGTSLLVIALKSFAGFVGYVGHTPLDWPLALSITVFAVVGSFGGAWLASRLSAQSLRQGFGWFVVTMAFFILAREAPPLIGLEPSFGLALLASALGTALVVLVRQLAARRRTRRRRGSTSTTSPTSPPADSIGNQLERS